MRSFFILCLLATLVSAAPATASTIIGRNTTAVTLQVNTRGEALVGYQADGKAQRVLAWGALNAIAPTEAQAQVNFQLDYSGGYKAHYTDNPLVKSAVARLRAL